MPKALEAALKKAYAKGKESGKLKNVDEGAYVYGAMRKTGWKPKREKG